jgi:Rrf2 family protein
MFRLSQKADYGFILLSHLARANGKVTSVSSIARKNKLSSKFLSQVASDLKKAEIIAAKEGVSGGYILAKKPEEISLLSVLGILEGGLVEGKCFEDDHECKCGAKGMWMEMKKDLEKSFGKKTVADLVR